jgi:hypothetical protein
MTTLIAALNDAPRSSLVRAYYDEHRHVVVLPGRVLSGKPSRGAFLIRDDLSNIISNTMAVIGNVTGGAVTARTNICCSIM